MKKLLTLLFLLPTIAFAQKSPDQYPHQDREGELYQIDADGTGGTDITVTTAGTYYPWITATAGDNDGMTADVTDAAGDSIQAHRAGDYQISFTVSFSGSVSSTVKFRVTVNGVNNDHGVIIRKLNASGDVGSAAVVFEEHLVPGDKVRVEATASGNGHVINIWAANLSVRE